MAKRIPMTPAEYWRYRAIHAETKLQGKINQLSELAAKAYTGKSRYIETTSGLSSYTMSVNSYSLEKEDGDSNLREKSQ